MQLDIIQSILELQNKIRSAGSGVKNADQVIRIKIGGNRFLPFPKEIPQTTYRFRNTTLKKAWLMLDRDRG